MWNSFPFKKHSIKTHSKTRTSKPQGFSLIEVMIVVVIIGILATMAYPNLQRYLVRSRQTEAKTNLTAIYTAEKIYFATNQAFTTDLTLLGVQIDTTNARYTYTITTASNNTTFTATATGNLDEDATNDIWTINQAKNLQNTSDDSSS